MFGLCKVQDKGRQQLIDFFQDKHNDWPKLACVIFELVDKTTFAREDLILNSVDIKDK